MPNYIKKIFQRYTGSIDMVEQDKYKLEIYGTLDTLVPGPGEITTTMLADKAVTYAKIQDIATNSLIGRDTTGTGVPEEITLNATLEMDGSLHLQRAALTGDITAPAGSNATTLATVNSNVGTFGSATQASVVTVNAKGLVTAASNSTVTPAESSVTFTDITTNDVSTTKHGYAPKGSNLSIPNVVLTGKSLGAGTSVTATVSGGVATVTHTTHGYTSGDIIVPSGATSSGSIGDFNQLHVITVTNSNTYTFTTTATGTISTPVELFWFSGTRSLNPTLIKDVDRSGGGFVKITFTNTQTDLYYGASGLGGSSAVANLFTATDNSNPATTTTFGFLFADSGGTGHDALTWLTMSFTGII